MLAPWLSSGKMWPHRGKAALDTGCFILDPFSPIHTRSLNDMLQSEEGVSGARNLNIALSNP